MNNAQIAGQLEMLADLLEFQNANPFRVRAYRNGARIIHDLAEPVTQLLAGEGKRLTDIDGIGADLAEKIATLATTGSLPLLEELQSQVPQSVLALLRIPGLGPKKASRLFHELKIQTLEQLKAACESHQIRELKGFGAKTEDSILAGMELAATANDRLYWADADKIAQELLAHLRGCPGVEQLEVAGSYRRGRETIGDLDLLAVADDEQAIMDRLQEFSGVADVIGRGETKLSVRLATGLQVDLRVVPAESFGAALQYFTGSKAHNVILRGMAKSRGLKINEYGVFRLEEGKPTKQKAAERRAADHAEASDATETREVYIAGRTEKEVYHALGLPLFPPEIREARQEFEWAAAGDLPTLIEVDDLQGDLHTHTNATDGAATIEEMVEAARRRGLKYVAITDHSQRVSMANGLTADRALRQWEAIDKLNERLDGFVVLKGIEVDILEKGGLDLPDHVLSQADWVVASVHYGQNQLREQITARIVDALANPVVSAIAHPTGRLINRRKPYEVDLEAVFAAAVEYGKLLELNANPARLDLDDVACAAAKAKGIPIVISTDAHSVDGLAVMRYGVLQARRAGLTKHDVANCRAWPQLKKSIGKRPATNRAVD